MSSTKKIAVHQFHPEIYPRRIWITKNANPDFIREHFKDQDGEELDEIDICFKTAKCSVWRVSYGEDKLLGVLVCITGSDFKGSKDIAHEAVHVADKIFKDCGVDMHYDHDEHYAYFVGWIADCIEQVVTGKFRD